MWYDADCAPASMVMYQLVLHVRGSTLMCCCVREECGRTAVQIICTVWSHCGSLVREQASHAGGWHKSSGHTTDTTAISQLRHTCHRAVNGMLDKALCAGKCTYVQ